MPKLKTKSGAKKRFKITGHRQGALRPGAASARDDQADQQADPQPARHRRPVQDRRRTTSRSTSCRTAEGSSAHIPQSFEGDSSMARVKRGVTVHAKHKKVLKAAKGFYGRRKNTIRTAKAGGRQGDAVRLPRPQEQEAHVPRALDPAPQRRGARARPDLFADLSTASARPGSRSTARFCPTSRSTSRRPSPPCRARQGRRCRSAAAPKSDSRAARPKRAPSHAFRGLPARRLAPCRRVRLRSGRLDVAAPATRPQRSHAEQDR